MVNVFDAERERIALTEPVPGPVWLDVTFTRKKPTTAPKKRRTYPVTWPDLDKLVRAVCDSLQDAGVIHSDAQVVEMRARKVYPLEYACSLDRPGAVVSVYQIED